MSVNTGHGLLVLTTAPGHGVDIHWVVILTQPVSVSVTSDSMVGALTWCSRAQENIKM